MPGAPPTLLLHTPWGLQGWCALFALPADVVQQFFLPFLESALTEAQPLVGQGQVSFRAIWSWLLSDMGQLLDSSHRGHPCSPPASKPFPRKPGTLSHLTWSERSRHEALMAICPGALRGKCRASAAPLLILWLFGPSKIPSYFTPHSHSHKPLF